MFLMTTLGIFVFGSIAFWLLLAAVTIGIIWSISALDQAYIDNYPPEDPATIGGGGFATFAICIFGALVIYSNHTDFSSPPRFLVVALIVFAYFICGLLTVFWKWSNYSQDLAKRYLEANDNFFQSYTLNQKEPIPASLKNEWDRSVGQYAQQPQEYRFMKLKTTWAIYWPWVMFWSLLHDLFTRLFQTILSFFNGFFARITAHHWKVVEANMPTFGEEEPTPPTTIDRSPPYRPEHRPGR